jgi:hypothetical protein
MSQNGNVYTNTQPLLIQLYGKADIKYAVTARANGKQRGRPLKGGSREKTPPRAKK